MTLVAKPQEGEYSPYTISYISLLPDDGLVLTQMQTNLQAVIDEVKNLPAAWLTTPFADGEWTVQEILVHIMDTERIFAHRALWIARGDATELPGFDQDKYVPFANANSRPLESILAEYETIRAATLSLFNSFDDAALTRIGVSNKNPLSVRAALYIIAGHELYHLKSIRDNYVGRSA